MDTTGPETPDVSPVVAPAGATKLRLLVLGVVLAVIAAGGVAAVVVRARGEAPIERRVPAGVAVFARVSLHPSLEQDRALASLYARLPSSERARVRSGLDSTLDDMAGSAGLSYGKDVKPWVGGQIGLAVTVPAKGDPETVALVTVRDEKAARSTLARVHDGETVWTIADGIAYLSNSRAAIAHVRTAARRKTLNADARFRSARASVGGNGLLLAWIDGAKVERLAKSVVPKEALSQLKIGDKGTAIVVARAETDGIALVGRTSGGGGEGKSGQPSLVQGIPASGLVGALTLFDLGSSIVSATKTPPANGGDPVSVWPESMRQMFGIDAANDLAPMLHGETSLVFGGLDELGSPRVGLLSRITDEAAATRVLAGIRASMPAMGGIPESVAGGFVVRIGEVDIVVRRSGGRLVIATGQKYGNELLSSSSATLAKDAVYRKVVGAGTDPVEMQLFVNLDRALALAKHMGATFDKDAEPFLSAFDGLGVRATRTKSGTSFRLFLSVAKR